MERIIKTELQPDGQMLLYYVDENGSTEQAILATVEGDNEDNGQTYTIVQELDESMIQYEVAPQEELPEPEQGGFREKWTDEETRRALIFYIDNKETFRNGQTKKKHLWTVACKTMLPHKNPAVCETKIRNLKRKYSLIHSGKVMTNTDEDCGWQFYDLCHQAFHDDVYRIQYSEPINEASTTANVTIESRNNILTMSAKNNKQAQADPIVDKMLHLYWRCKKAAPKLNERWQKTIFQKIAVELGETAEYWHKRFLNFKAHYIKILDKHKMGNLTQIETSWPYLDIFEKIFEGDEDFHNKYGIHAEVQQPYSIHVEVQQPVQEFHVANEVVTQEIKVPLDWNMTEQTVLVKYYFDSFDEFQDVTIPDSYLWGEIGRLLDKTPEKCKNKYEKLRDAHLNQYIKGTYSMSSRHPIAILYDNIIYKEVEIELADVSQMPQNMEVWSVDQVDVLVQFFCNNLEQFKDSMCHYVCWAALSKKLDEPIHNCRLQWKDLTSLYKSILNDKKENPDMQIDWRYTDMFDRLFDYGTDTKLLDDLLDKEFQTQQVDQVVDEQLPVSDDEDYDPKDGKRARGTMDPKQCKILEYYLKNKDKFSTNQRVKKAMWQELAKEMGFTPEHCAHRFRNLKQVYMAYVQREMNIPEKPILWPYYELCKKVFGYRAVKSQLRNKSENYVSGEWSPKEIKALIRHFADQYNATNGVEEKIDWSEVSQELKRSETACRDKFIDLRKSYRQIRTMVNRGGKCKVSWKYYSMFETIYMKQNVKFERSAGLEEGTELDELVESKNAEASSEVEFNQEDEVIQEDEINQEGEVIQDDEVNQEGEVMQENEEDEVNQVEANSEQVTEKVVTLNIVEGDNHLGMDFETEIDSIEEGNVVATPDLQTDDEPMSQEENYYYNAINLPMDVLEKGLKYYLENIEEFVHPKYDKDFAWQDLCKQVNDATKIEIGKSEIIDKINHLKQVYSEGNKYVEFADIVKDIVEKEHYMRVCLEAEPKPMLDEANEVPWSDNEIEQLLRSYLDNLDKFKNPKYVRSYLWQDVSRILQKNPLACSRKMSEVRQMYRSIVKGKSDTLVGWKFYGLCRQIYGDGTKSAGHSLFITD